MRRVLIALVLPLLMLLAQQGAIAHEFVHLRGQLGSDESGKKAPADAACLSCLSCASLAGLAHGHPAPQLLLALGQARPLTEPAVARDARAPSPRSRGPPFVL